MWTSYSLAGRAIGKGESDEDCDPRTGIWATLREFHEWVVEHAESIGRKGAGWCYSHTVPHAQPSATGRRDSDVEFVVALTLDADGVANGEWDELIAACRAAGLGASLARSSSDWLSEHPKWHATIRYATPIRYVHSDDEKRLHLARTAWVTGWLAGVAGLPGVGHTCGPDLCAFSGVAQPVFLACRQDEDQPPVATRFVEGNALDLSAFLEATGFEDHFTAWLKAQPKTRKRSVPLFNKLGPITRGSLDAAAHEAIHRWTTAYGDEFASKAPRNDGCLAIGGALARTGLDKDVAYEIVTRLCASGGMPDPERRGGVARYSAGRQGKGLKTKGWAYLRDTYSRPFVRGLSRLAEALGGTPTGNPRAPKQLPVIEPSALDAIYSGCPLMRAWNDRQAAGMPWRDRETWRLGAGVILPLGGRKEIARLDQLAGGSGTPTDTWSPEASSTCAALAAQLVKDPDCPDHLRPLLQDCGTLHSPCGFSPNGDSAPSPARHATHTTQIPTPIDLRDVEVVREAMSAELHKEQRATLLAGGCGSGKSSLIREKLKECRGLVATSTHDLAREWVREMAKLGVVDVVRIPSLEDSCLLPLDDLRRRAMTWHRANGRSGTLACEGCPWKRNECPYWSAQRGAEEAQVVLMTHALLATKSWERYCGTDRLLCVDEDPLDALVPRKSYDLATLSKLSHQAIRAPGVEQWDLQGPLDCSLTNLAGWLLERLAGARGLVALHANEVPKDLLPERAVIEDPDAVPLMRWAAYVRGAQNEPIALFDGGRKPVVTLSWRASIPPSMGVVVADATPDPEALSLALGRDFVSAGGPTQTTNKLVRYFDVAASRGALHSDGPRRDRAFAVLRALRERHKDERMGLVTTLKVEQELEGLGPPIKVEAVSHYGAARGSNEMRTGQVDVGVVLGVHRTPPEVVRAWAFFLGGANIEELDEQPASRAYQDEGVSYRVHGYRIGSALDRADRAITLATLQQAVGRFVGVKIIYVVADYNLGLGEELRCAAYDLRVPLLKRTTGRPPTDVAILVETARELRAGGLILTSRGAARKCAREAQQRGWPGSEKTAMRQWKIVLDLLSGE